MDNFFFQQWRLYPHPRQNDKEYSISEGLTDEGLVILIIINAHYLRSL
jgi:hypothetical protein